MFKMDGKIGFMPLMEADGKGGAAAASPAGTTVTPPAEVEPEVDEILDPGQELEVEGEDDDELPPGVGPKKGPPPGHPRWERVYKGFKEAQRYSQYGSPEQVEASLRRLQRYDEQIEAAERKGKGETEETAELKAAREKVEEQLKKMFPWFEDAQSTASDHKLIRESLRLRAAEATVALMEEQGIEVDKESYKAFSGVLQEILASDERLYTIYMTDPERAVKEAAAKYAAPFRQSEDRKRKADLIRAKEPHKNLPKPAPKSAGGPTPAPTQPEPKDIKEAETRFLAGLRQVNKG